MASSIKPDERDEVHPKIEVVSIGAQDKQRPWRNSGHYGRNRHALIWTTRGQGRIVIAGSRKGVGAHNAIFIPAGTMFSLDMGQMFGSILWLSPDLDLQTPDKVLHLRMREVQKSGELTSLLDAIQQELNSEKLENTRAALAYANLCLVWLDRHHQDSANTRIPASEKLLGKYCALIEEKYETGIKTQEYAKELRVTLTHLSRVCKRQCGTTAADLLADRIMIEAREKLMKEDASIRSISVKMNFSTPGNFTRFFLRHSGESPQSFRSRINSS